MSNDKLSEIYNSSNYVLRNLKSKVFCDYAPMSTLYVNGKYLIGVDIFSDGYNFTFRERTRKPSGMLDMYVGCLKSHD